MRHFLRFWQVFALGTWLGSIIFFSFAVAPGVFGILASRDEAGAVVGFALGRLHLMGLIAAIVFILAALGLGRSLKALIKPAALAVLAMFLLTLASQWIVIPRMETLRLQMGPVAATSSGNPLRVEFDRLHGVSVKLEGAVLLIGVVAMFLTVRGVEEKS